MYSDKKNSVWLSIQYLSTLIFSFITLKINLSNFGQEQFGIWLLLASFWGISSVIDMGFGTSIIRYVAEARNRNDFSGVNKIISTGFLIFIVLGLILLVGGNFLGNVIYFDNPNLINKAFSGEAKIVFLLLGLAFYLRYITILLKSIFEGLKNFVLHSQLSILYNCLILVAVIFISALKLSLVSLAMAYFLSSVLLLVLHFVYLKIKYPEVSFSKSLLKYSEIKSLFKFSMSVQVASIFGAFIDPLIKYFLGSFISIETVSSYEVARRFAVAISGLFATSFRTILPKASVLKNRNEFGEFIMSEGIKITKLGIVYSGFTYGVFSVIIIIIIKLWFGIEQSIFIFLILSLPETVNNAGYAVYMTCLGIGKAFYLAVIQGVNLILISLSLIFGIWLFKGYLGLLGFFASELIVNFLLLKLIKNFSGINIIEYLKKIGIDKLLLSLLLTFTVILLGLNFNINIYILSAALSVFSLFLYWNETKQYIKIFGTLFPVSNFFK